MISLAHAQTAAPAAADPTGGFMQLLPMILMLLRYPHTFTGSSSRSCPRSSECGVLGSRAM